MGTVVGSETEAAVEVTEEDRGQARIVLEAEIAVAVPKGEIAVSILRIYFQLPAKFFQGIISVVLPDTIALGVGLVFF